MLKIVTLVENTSISQEYRKKHGLSLYIETEKHKILFDVGPDDSFARNARKMNIDLSLVDTVIISHGHFDHGGGLKKLMALNPTAKIYIRREAFTPHFIKVLGLSVDVGLDKKLVSGEQIIFTDDLTVIDDELTLFSNVTATLYPTKSNKVLRAKMQGQLTPDDFCHEQNLIISARERYVLVCGCAHAGIVNIQNKAEAIVCGEMSTVIGGFHLYNPPTKKYERGELIDSIAKVLKGTKSQYYTCHCTGIKAFERMKLTLNDRMHYLSAGSITEL